MYLCSVDTVRFEVTTEWDSASSSTSQCACHQKIYRHFPPRFTHYRDTISVNPLPRRMTMTILISTQWHCFFFPRNDQHWYCYQQKKHTMWHPCYKQERYLSGKWNVLFPSHTDGDACYLLFSSEMASCCVWQIQQLCLFCSCRKLELSIMSVLFYVETRGKCSVSSHQCSL